ncbi:MAG: tRNA uridine(34) 5-carboxymethylaminomethyl modification radical SAM/GNAT enzyme Elp3 [Coriobacteriia bacterium]|nr:tRNA uridine(34) 5-carboxymethylaminomethyl modification radical SAM/GNAT enzyme Elp3 [Coriobacteriia bacterium]
MEEMLLNIIDELRLGNVTTQAPDGSSYIPSDAEMFSRLIDRLGKGRPDAQDYSKHVLLSYYQGIKQDDPDRWKVWGVEPKVERKLLRVLQTKPRRTASGVATITVITKPWRCASDCLYCPNDVRMPKSYLSDEPACQRAERNFFDPYLQVQARLQVLDRMGHLTDKIEIIVLGGSWCDYPKEYQLWFVRELYRALNDGEAGQPEAEALRQHYLKAGFTDDKDELIRRASAMQERVNAGEINYNQAIRELYEDCAENEVKRQSLEQSRGQSASQSSDQSLDQGTSQDQAFESLYYQQKINESSQHRMVGFTVETRPDLVTANTLVLMRKLGVTRLQIGIQSLDPQVLKLNKRKTSSEQIRNAFALARVFGFKIHGHFMQNLYGSTCKTDKAEYAQFMTDPAYIPDEIKLYPCSLVAGTGLVAHYQDGSWQPYSEDDLIALLAANTLNTPPFMRISRMIRDISSHDIMVGNKRTNLRQLVEKHVADTGGTIREIRHREVSNQEVTHDDLRLEVIRYGTTVSREYFLQWVTRDDKIAGFLRLSLPSPDRSTYLPVDEDQLPTSPDTAFIREVHVYGKVAAINKAGEHAQHFGLGRQLVEKACEIAADSGYTKLNVISSVGTREYYRKLDFSDGELYQERTLAV